MVRKLAQTSCEAIQELPRKLLDGFTPAGPSQWRLLLVPRSWADSWWL